MGINSIAPVRSGVDVTPDNSNDLSQHARALYVGVSGDVKVDTVEGDTLTFVGVPIGFFPVSVKRVYATGTTATNIIALY